MPTWLVAALCVAAAFVLIEIFLFLSSRPTNQQPQPSPPSEEQLSFTERLAKTQAEQAAAAAAQEQWRERFCDQEIQRFISNSEFFLKICQEAILETVRNKQAPHGYYGGCLLIGCDGLTSHQFNGVLSKHFRSFGNLLTNRRFIRAISQHIKQAMTNEPNIRLEILDYGHTIGEECSGNGGRIVAYVNK